MNLTQNILTTLSARITTTALALISSIALARLLGPEGRGLLALLLLLPELAISFGLFGFEQANAVYAGLEPAGRRSLVWQSAAIAGVVGSIMVVAGIFFLALGAPGFSALAHVPFWLALLPLAIVPAKMVVQYWWAILRGMNQILLLNIAEVGTRVIAALLIVVFVGWLQFDVRGAVWADAVIDIGSVGLAIVLLRYVGVWGKSSFDRCLWQRTARFAIPAHAGTIMSYLNYRVDQLIIAAMLPSEQLGFYVIAVGLAERLWLLTGTVATVLLPHLANSRERDPELSALIARHVLIWTGAACLLVYVLADVVVRLLYSSAFAEAVAPLRWLLPGIFILSAGKVLVAEILAREKVYFTAWVAGFAALINLAGNILLIPHMGISGAALASSISYSLVSLIVTWYYLWETGVSWTALIPRQSDLSIYTVLWHRSIAVIPLGDDV